jgi:hypothetical protein
MAEGVIGRFARGVGRDVTGLEGCKTRQARRPAAVADGARTTPGFRPVFVLRSAQVRSLTAA